MNDMVNRTQSDELLKQIEQLQAKLAAQGDRIKELEAAASKPAAAEPAEPEVAQPGGAPGPEPVSPAA